MSKLSKEELFKFMYYVGKSAREKMLSEARKVGGKKFESKIKKDLKKLIIKIY